MSRSAPEGALTEEFADLHDSFDVVVGSYPARGDEMNRIKVSASDRAELDAAMTWLRDHVEVVEESAD